MPGIAGLVSATKDRPPRHVLERMIEALDPRRPNDVGALLDGPVGIGMRRSNTIDVAADDRPMMSPDGRVSIAYDGEIYNHPELRSELSQVGYVFRTRSDTEVLLHGYDLWGISGLCRRLNGVFAICVWDGRLRRLHLARDPFGVKPLHFVERGSWLAFSSKIRSLARSGLLGDRIDEIALWGYLTYGFTPTNRGLVAGVTRLGPGEILTWANGHRRVERYWSFPDEPEDGSASPSERRSAVLEMLERVTRRQTPANVPVGCLLGGGLDSAIVAALANRFASGRIRTFSISLPEGAAGGGSESAERVARDLGMEHESVALSEQELLDSAKAFLDATDEPVADPGMFGIHLLSGVAARHVKVVFTGRGADEIFAGHPHHRRFLRGTASPRRPPREPEIALDFVERLRDRIGRIVPVPRQNLGSAISGSSYAMDPGFLWQLLGRDRRPSRERLERYAREIEEAAASEGTKWSPLQRSLVADARIGLAQGLLPGLDATFGAHALEGRSPFLDRELVELAFRFPAKSKLGRDRGKRVLREAVRGLVPAFAAERDDDVTRIPLARWLREDWGALARETLLDPTWIESSALDRAAVEALLLLHQELGYDVARPLWTLLRLSGWWRRLRAVLAETRAFPEPSVPPIVSNGLPWARPVEAGRCDIVIPIYDGLNYVRDLLRSIDRHTTDVPHRLLLVDDSCNDETHERLKEIAEEREDVRLLRNDRNLGFAMGCNRAIAEGRSEWVCVMNSDTLATAGWLSAMIRCAKSDPSIAVVNPLSNQCVNLSVPMPPGLNLDSMARILASRENRRVPNLTTGVGFCMLLRRRFLDWLGPFDSAYGLGYCEESDLCMRFTEAGLRVVAAEDAFVYHKGAASFDDGIERYQTNRKIFDARWQDAYERDYANFLRRNPLKRIRDDLVRHTIRRSNDSPTIRSAIEASARATDRDDDGNRRRPSPAARDQKTPCDPEQREVRYPTRAYLSRLQKVDSLRITFLAESLGLSGGVISIVQLAREFLLAGCEVKIVTLSEEIFPERLNLPLQPLVYRSKEELVRLFPESDVVVATYWTTAYDYLRSLHERYDFLSVYYIQDYEGYFYPSTDVENRARVASTYALADRRIVMSRWLRSLIEARHATPCEIVPIGQDSLVFRPRQRRDGPAAEKPRVVSVARPHEPRRGFADLVRAFSIVHRERPDVELVLFGCKRDDLPELPFPVSLPGRIENPNRVAELIGSCDVLVDSSLFHGFGRPGLEAMGCGTPPVLTWEGGVREYAVDGENAILVPPGRPGAIARGVLRLLSDPALWVRLRDRGLLTARRFDHEHEARVHMSLYERWWREKYPMGRPSWQERIETSGAPA